MFEETLYQNTRKGQSMVDALKQNVSRGGGPPRFMPASQPASSSFSFSQRLRSSSPLRCGTPGSCKPLTRMGSPSHPPSPPAARTPPDPSPQCFALQTIIPGIKVDKGLHPLDNSNGESWCAGLDGLSQRCADYYKQVRAVWGSSLCLYILLTCLFFLNRGWPDQLTVQSPSPQLLKPQPLPSAAGRPLLQVALGGVHPRRPLHHCRARLRLRPGPLRRHRPERRPGEALLPVLLPQRAITSQLLCGT